MHKIILDTDIGDDIDDALALAYALMCGEIELLGVTTVFRDTVRRAELACCVLEALGRSDVWVYAGLGKPLLDPVAEGRASIASHEPHQMQAIERYPASTRPAARDADLVSRSLDPAAAGGGLIGGKLAGGGWGGSQERNPEAVDRDSAAAPGAQRAAAST